MRDMNLDGVITISDITPWVESLLEALNAWILHQGSWLTWKIIETDFGVFFEISHNGILAFLIGIIAAFFQLLIMIGLFAIVFQAFKAWFDSFISCINKTSDNYPKCRTGFFTFFTFLFLILAAWLQVSWLHNLALSSFVVSWIIWYSQGKWWGK